MPSVQIVYASRHGGTAGIADRIAEVLRAGGVDVAIASADEGPDPTGFDAYLVGSGVYMGSWLKEGIEFLERNQATLADRPTWLFSSGPLPGSTKESTGTDALSNALGPTDGPGSGGRKKIDALSAVIHPRGHEVFQGAFDPTDPPKAMSERLVRMMPAAKGILPPGDFREWPVIEAWARTVARELRGAVPVA
jgi:menaquinone-dependent protoporphyrinogen oxidase